MTTPRIEEMVEEFEDMIAPALGYVHDDGEWMMRDLDSSLTRPVHTNDLDKALSAYRTALTQAHQAGIDEAVEIVKGLKKDGSDETGDRIEKDGYGYLYERLVGYNIALDDTIKALQDNK